MSHTLHSQQQLDAMKSTLLCMAANVGDMLAQCLKAFLERDADLAAHVVSLDDAIDAMDNDLDELCLQLLARLQPVAADLRYVVAAMRLTSELERIADEACNIAEHTIALAKLPPTLPHPVMRTFSDHAAAMFRTALEAFRTGNSTLAREVCTMEDKADELHIQAVRTCFEALGTELHDTQISLFRIFISRSLERICDLSTNIGELTVFANEGSVIKHKWQLEKP